MNEWFLVVAQGSCSQLQWEGEFEAQMASAESIPQPVKLWRPPIFPSTLWHQLCADEIVLRKVTEQEHVDRSLPRKVIQPFGNRYQHRKTLQELHFACSECAPILCPIRVFAERHQAI